MRHLAKAERVNMFKILTHKNGFGVEDCESKPEIGWLFSLSLAGSPSRFGHCTGAGLWGECRYLHWLRAQVEIFPRSNQWIRGAPKVSPQSYIYTP